MPLKPEHAQMLMEGSAIAPALIQHRGYESLPQPEDLIDRGFSKAQAKTAPALGPTLMGCARPAARLANPPGLSPPDARWQGL